MTDVSTLPLGVWKCTIMDNGGQSVMTPLVRLRLTLLVDNLALQQPLYLVI